MKKSIIILFVFILFISFSHASLTIKVNSLSDSVVELTLMERTSSYIQVIKKLNQTTNKSGDAIFIYDEKLPSTIDIYSRVKKKSYVLFTSKFFSQPTDKPISLSLFQEGSIIQVNSTLPTLQENDNLSLNNSDTTINNITNISSNLQAKSNNTTTETNSSQTQQITGAVITESSSSNKDYLKYIFYTITIGIILGLAIFFFYKKNQNKSQPFQHHGKIVLKEHSSSAHDLTQEDNIQHHHDHKKYSSNNQEYLKLKSQRRMEELKRRMEQDLDEFKRLEKGSFYFNLSL